MRYEDNPFRVLGISQTDGKHEIFRKVEEKELLIDQQQCANARTMLASPQRRVEAEIHWFLDCDDASIKEIEDYIATQLEGKDSDNLQCAYYCPLTQLNIQLACIGAQEFENPLSAKDYILGVSRLFESIDVGNVLQMINTSRSKAGFPAVISVHEVEPALAELRTEIKQNLSRHLQSIPEDRYIQIVTLLSESYSGNQKYKGQAVLEDIILEYQIYIDDTLHQLGQSIIKTAKFILMGAKKIDVRRAVADLLDQLRAWDKLAQPLQLGALTKGSSHEESKQLLLSLRELAANLYNEHGFTEESFAITIATQEVFKELPEYAELLNEDNQALTGIIEENGKEETPDPEMLREQETAEKIEQSLKQLEKSMKDVQESLPEQRKEKINRLLSQMTELDKFIKWKVSNRGLRNQHRERIAYMVRSVGIELHNTNKDFANSLNVIEAVKEEFGDLDQISHATNQDISVLTSQISRQIAAEVSKKKKRRGIIISACVAFALLVGWLVIGVLVSKNQNSNQTSLSTTPTPRPTVKPTSTTSPTSNPAATPKPTTTPKPASTFAPAYSSSAQERPENGHVFYTVGTKSTEYCQLKIVNQHSEDYYIKLVKFLVGDKAVCFYVRGNSTATVDVPSGMYELKMASGSTWYGEKDYFGTYTSYSKDPDSYVFSYDTIWTVTLYSTYSSTSDSSGLITISKYDFE